MAPTPITARQGLVDKFTKQIVLCKVFVLRCTGGTRGPPYPADTFSSAMTSFDRRVSLFLITRHPYLLLLKTGAV